MDESVLTGKTCARDMILLLIVSVGAGEEVPIPAGIRRRILIRMVLLSLSRTPD